MEFLRIYGSFVRMFLKARMEYRFSFFSGIIANFYCYFVTYITFWVIVNGFGSINGWSFDDMVILYALNLLSYCITGLMFWGVLGLEHEVTSGNLDVLLIRPMGVIKQIVCKRFQDTFLGQLAVTLIFLSIALANVRSLLVPWKYAYLALSIASGVLIHAGAMTLFGAFSFWTNRSLVLSDQLYYNLRAFINYPLSVFPAFIKQLLTFVLPWAFINYYPALILLNKPESQLDFWMGVIAPLVGAGFFALSVFVFHRGLQRYSGSGS